MLEWWYDRRHTGALRVIHRHEGHILGSDPAEPYWKVRFKTEGSGQIVVDFATKRTHHGRRVMVATYRARRNELHWPDGNVWLRVRMDPRLLA